LFLKYFSTFSGSLPFVIPRARFLVALTVSNVSKCGKSAGFAPDSLFFSEIFQTIFRNLSVFTGNCCFTSAGAAPQVFFWGKKANVANVFLVFLPFPCQDVEKVEVFLQNPFFLQAYIRKVFRKNKSFQMYCVSFFRFHFSHVFSNIFSQARV